MRKALATFAATAMLLATAATTVAAKPDDVWRYAETGGPAYDDFWSTNCGFEVSLAYRLQFSGTKLNSFFQVERDLTGPGGTATQLVSLSFRYPDGFQEVEDPDTGLVWTIYREVGKGSFVWTTPQDGVIYRDAGYAAVTWHSAFPEEGDEIVYFDDEVYHGQWPAGDEDVVALVCEALA